MRVADRIRSKLTAGLAPSRLEILDDSARHAGHAGSREGGETHFTVLVVSDRFTGQSRIERQRAIHRLLAEELAGPVHALSLQALTPAEAAKK